MFKYLSYCAISLLIFTSCNDDEGAPNSTDDGNDPIDENLIWLVKTESFVSNGNNGNYFKEFNYDDLGRTDQLEYEDLYFHKESTETNGNTGVPFSSKEIFLDNSYKVIRSVYKGLHGFNWIYRNSYTYDAQGRITQVITEEQQRNENGTPVTNFEVYEKYTYEWDANNNLTSRKLEVYNPVGSATPSSYTETTYSGFENAPMNTLKTQNFGFDFYGSHSFYSSLNTNDCFDGGFAGDRLPSEMITNNYNHNHELVSTFGPLNFTYQTDDKNRVIERKAEYTYDGTDYVETNYYTYEAFHPQE